MTQFDFVDRILMYLSGGLLVLAIPVMGTIEMLAGNSAPMYAYEVTQSGETTSGYALNPSLAPEGAEIVSSPVFDPNLRAYLVVAALAMLAVAAIYNVARAASTDEPAGETPTPAD